jgi:hypothetical protein
MSQARAKLFFIFSLVVMFAVSATVVYNNYQTGNYSLSYKQIVRISS